MQKCPICLREFTVGEARVVVSDQHIHPDGCFITFLQKLPAEQRCVARLFADFVRETPHRRRIEAGA